MPHTGGRRNNCPARRRISRGQDHLHPRVHRAPSTPRASCSAGSEPCHSRNCWEGLTVRAIQIDRFGGPTVLEVREVPNPVPAAGELLVRTTASSINPVDVKTRSRVYETGIPPLPMMLGWDLAGMVADRGTTVLRPGQRVIAMSPQLAAGAGTWADLVAFPAGLVAPAPATVSLGEAATLPLAGLTAWQALDWLRLGVGDRLLVTGGAGASADSCSRSPRTAELPWTPCSIPAPTRRPLSSSGHFLPAATGGRVRYAQACAHRIMAGRRRVSDGAGRFATAISVCEIRVHIGLICAGALAQPVRRTTARNRRSEIVRAKDNVSDYGGA